MNLATPINNKRNRAGVREVDARDREEWKVSKVEARKIPVKYSNLQFQSLNRKVKLKFQKYKDDDVFDNFDNLLRK